MATRWSRVVDAFATALVFMLAGAVALFALYRLLSGVPLSVVWETSGSSPDAPQVLGSRAPYLPAVIPLAAALALMVGVLVRRLAVARAGLIVLSTFSGLFLFSSGAALLPIVGVVFVLLLVISVLRRAAAK